MRFTIEKVLSNSADDAGSTINLLREKWHAKVIHTFTFFRTPHLEDSLMKYIDCTNDSIDMDCPIPVIELVPLQEQE